jgi:hypothetical protein
VAGALLRAVQLKVVELRVVPKLHRAHAAVAREARGGHVQRSNGGRAV